jgi:hypothetical protein
VYLQAQKWGYELSTTEAAHIAEAALEAQSAPLVADSREALVDGNFVLALAGSFNGDEAGDVDQVFSLMGDYGWAMRGGNDLHAVALKVFDALLASGLVSLAADRDRATAERAWEEGFHAAGLLFGLVPQRDLARRNPYRESEGK